MVKHNKLIVSLALFATILALIVVLLGAYTRLRDAGLGCPDWPGCYGQFSVPHTPHALMQAKKQYPTQMVESEKAWAEMIHRYAAGILVTLIFILAIFAIMNRSSPYQPLWAPLLLVGLALFQALVGKWTVTMKLYPPIVMGHLLGGMAILAILCWTYLELSGSVKISKNITLQNIKSWALIGLVIAIVQITLGGWTSANYAAPSCADFPTCQGVLLPATMDFKKGFDLIMPVGANFQGGVLDNAARIAIHVVHRIGAMATFLYLSIFALLLIIKSKNKKIKTMACIMIILLLLQISLGIFLILNRFPLAIAVAHNGVAALLLLSLVTLNNSLYPRLKRENV